MSNLLQSLIITKLIKLFYLFCCCKNIVGKSKEYLKVIKNTLLDTSGNPETLKKNNHRSWKPLQQRWLWLARIFLGRSASCFVYGFVFQVISE